jgi:hypothetical protein
MRARSGGPDDNGCMRPRTNEFSHIDRSIVSPDGTTFEFVRHDAFGTGGWTLVWGKGMRTRDPVITVYVKGEAVHEELAADRKDAERIISRLEGQLRGGVREPLGVRS